MKSERFVQDDYSTTAHSLDDYYDAGGTGKTVNTASGRLAHEVKRGGRGRAAPKFCLLPNAKKERANKAKDYTVILDMLPATYEQIAAGLGVCVQTAKGAVAELRKQGHNVRAVGAVNDYRIELISGVVKLAPPKLRSWQDL